MEAANKSQEPNCAILFVHGILGTPEHFEPFLPLVPKNLHICNLLLKGHGAGVKDFSRASMAQWKQQVHEALQALRQKYNKVFIAAHSMGTLFAIQEAIAEPVTALFLLNVPLKVRLRPELLKTSWKVFRGDIDPNDPWIVAADKAYGIEKDPHVLRYLGWIPRYLELFAEIRKTRKMLHKLASPCMVYLSTQDEMVSPKTCKAFEGLDCVTLKVLPGSGHNYYCPKDLLLLQEDFQNMLT